MKIKSASRLAIVGNGFDLAHGMNTLYQHFVAATGDDCFLPYRKHLEKYCGSDKYWHDFEAKINALTLACFLHRMTDEGNDAQLDIEDINRQFRVLHDQLFTYLSSEEKRRKCHTLPLVKRYLTSSTAAITFNYTDTAELYTKNIYYVHGSLQEQEIILGYDFREDPCLLGYQECQWNKEICRQQLSFHRYLREELGLSPSGKTYQEMVQNFDEIESWRNSGRGFEDEIIDGWKHEAILRAYLEKEQQYLTAWENRIGLDKIREIVVLGHSIVSDQVFLEDLLKKCSHLEQVTIFSYRGEKKSSFQEKKTFFQPYCKKVKKRYYHFFS